MRDGGKTIKLLEKVGSSTLMVMFMMDRGKMTKLMVTESIAISMEQNMRVTGKKINNMDKDWKLGPTVQSTKDNTCKEKSMDTVASPGLMEVHTQDNSLKTIFKELESIIGPMEESTTVYG